MSKQKELGNKGFSLVELIVVIAIMAILVGVLAPSLIRYVEKSNVSADTQLADAVKTAVLTAMMDPTVINSADTSSQDFIDAHNTSYVSIDTDCTGTFAEAVKDTLGIPAGDAINETLVEKLKSAHDPANAEIQVQIVGNNSVAVRITTTDAEGKKNTGSGNNIEVK